MGNYNAKSGVLKGIGVSLLVLAVVAIVFVIAALIYASTYGITFAETWQVLFGLIPAPAAPVTASIGMGQLASVPLLN